MPGEGRSGGGSLNRLGNIELPAHRGPGGFDHAAVHGRAGRLYVAHTANHALDIIDTRAGRYLDSIGGLTGVAGALVSEAEDLVFTSNRGEDTVGVLRLGAVTKIPVGRRPNGLAYDPGRRLLLAANVGEPASLSLIALDQEREIARLPMPGRTRWAIFDPVRQAFLVNIMDPARIVIVEAANPSRLAVTFDVPSAGPHGLDLDVTRRRLYCACDAGAVIVLDADTGSILGERPLSGSPDVVFLDSDLGLLYVASGDPGALDVFDTRELALVETVPTEPGAHSLAFDPASHKLYALLPASHRAAVFLPAGVPA